MLWPKLMTLTPYIIISEKSGKYFTFQGSALPKLTSKHTKFGPIQHNQYLTLKYRLKIEFILQSNKRNLSHDQHHTTHHWILLKFAGWIQGRYTMTCQWCDYFGECNQNPHIHCHLKLDLCIFLFLFVCYNAQFQRSVLSLQIGIICVKCESIDGWARFLSCLFSLFFFCNLFSFLYMISINLSFDNVS